MPQVIQQLMQRTETSSSQGHATAAELTRLQASGQRVLLCSAAGRVCLVVLCVLRKCVKCAGWEAGGGGLLCKYGRHLSSNAKPTRMLPITLRPHTRTRTRPCTRRRTATR